jgi:hypothetical protein
MKRSSKLLFPTLAAFALAWAAAAEAASHREAPLIAMDPAADNTDVYAFVSYDEANLGRASADRRVTFIENVNPGQDPSDGPNYFNFDDEVRYTINIDNDRDGKADDVVYEFRFTTENRPVVAAGDLTSPLPYLGNPHIPIAALEGITALDGPGSEGLTRRQTYTVTEIRHGKRTELFKGRTLVAVPSNVGPATMPNYPALAAQGIYTDAATGIRVFAGQRAETFYIDLGAVFDTLNLRRFLPALTGPGEDADNVNPFGVNRFSGANISTIAIEVPITRITSDGKPAGTTKDPIIGVYAETDRPKVKVLRQPGEPAVDAGPFVQVSRMANPLVNELIITTPFKDGWNAAEPENEADFQEFYKTPVVAAELKLVFGVDVVPTPRTDLMSLLLKYPGQSLNGTDCGSPCAELLRLDLSKSPTAPENQSRLGSVLGGDPAGFPNGRRPNDDVTDIVVRVVGGANYINAHIGDGVNFLAGAPGVVGVDITANGIARNFPFLPTPYDGKNRVHVDCGETGPGGNPCGKLVPP